MPLSPAEPACSDMPQGWGLFAWMENGKGYFRENLRLIAEKTNLPLSELKNSPALQIEALARAYELYCQDKRLAPKDPQTIKNFLIALSYLPIPDDPLTTLPCRASSLRLFAS